MATKIPAKDKEIVGKKAEKQRKEEVKKQPPIKKQDRIKN
jgi:hypothetical protein